MSADSEVCQVCGENHPTGQCLEKQDSAFENRLDLLNSENITRAIKHTLPYRTKLSKSEIKDDKFKQDSSMLGDRLNKLSEEYVSLAQELSEEKPEIVGDKFEPSIGDYSSDSITEVTKYMYPYFEEISKESSAMIKADKFAKKAPN